MSDDATSVPWTCQVLFAQRDDDVVVLDLVAMEPCPFDEMRSGMPFTIRLEGADALSYALVEDWERESRFVTLRAVQIVDQQWLYVAEHGR